MTYEEYMNIKAKRALTLTHNGKFYKKSRALLIKNNKLCVIRLDSNVGKKTHYLLPGGDVDAGETSRQAALREVTEEYGVQAKIVKFAGKQYYKAPLEYDGQKFVSNRVVHFYICEYVSDAPVSEYGIDGEFKRTDVTYTRTMLGLSELKKIDYHDLNSMSKQVYDNLIAYLQSKTKAK